MIMKEAMEKWMIRQQMQGRTSVLTKGDIIEIKQYKIKMNFGIPTMVLKRPFQVEFQSRPQTSKVVLGTNNIDPNVFGTAAENQ